MNKINLLNKIEEYKTDLSSPQFLRNAFETGIYAVGIYITAYGIEKEDSIGILAGTFLTSLGIAYFTRPKKDEDDQ